MLPLWVRRLDSLVRHRSAALTSTTLRLCSRTYNRGTFHWLWRRLVSLELCCLPPWRTVIFVTWRPCRGGIAPGCQPSLVFRTCWVARSPKPRGLRLIVILWRDHGTVFPLFSGPTPFSVKVIRVFSMSPIGRWFLKFRRY